MSMVGTIDIVGLKPAAWLAILGAILEVSGFLLVAVELIRAQRRELDTAGPFQFLLTFGGWVRVRWRRLLGKTVTHEVSATVASTVAIAGGVSARLGTESEELIDRIRVLEENFKQLDIEVAGHRQELDERISKEAGAQETALAEFGIRFRPGWTKNGRRSRSRPHFSGGESACLCSGLVPALRQM